MVSQVKHVASVIVSLVALVGCSTHPREQPTYEPIDSDAVVAFNQRVHSLMPEVSASDLSRAPCPGGMVEVEGDFCPNVEEVCLRWVGIHGETLKAGGGQTGRCGEFQKPSRCLSKTLKHLHYCLDRFEWPNIEGQRPKSWMTWYDAKRETEAAGKRLCTVSEWTMACEGPEMQPYPYGDGYTRDRTACNFDNPLPKGLDVFHARKHSDATSQALDAMLVPSGAMQRCVSPFGMRDVVGNIDEWVMIEGGGRPSGLMSGHIFGVRNRCRGLTDGHGPLFGWYESGTRACKDITKER